jgi:ubiquinone biosynthesis protein
MGLIGNLALVVGFAWVVRGLLGTRSVTWPRLLLAVVVGSLLGATLAGLLLIDATDLADPTRLDVTAGELATLALPFQIVATMLFVIVLELVRAAPPQPRQGWRLRRPFAALRGWAGVVARALEVTRVLTRHGLAPLLGLRRGEVASRDPAELARRARQALEEAGGMFVKLGQLLVTRPDLLPPAALEELGRLHASAQPLGPEVIRAELATAFGRPVDAVFASFEDRPLGSASIAQAHRARLVDGRSVVVKVQRPGLERIVARDLAIVRWLARTAERRTAWGRAYGAVGLAEEFAEALRTELDFVAEARNAAELAAAVATHPSVRVPAMVMELTSGRVLVMEHLEGHTLAATPDEPPSGTARELADALCASQLAAMLDGERFHGDPHPGNVLLLADGRLGLIDFGITGKLDAFERASVFQLLVAIHLGSPTLLVESLVAVGAVHPTQDRDELERQLARFLAAHLGPGLPPADALAELLRLTGELGIRLPPQTSVMFRALATLAGTLERLVPGYPLIEQVARIGGAELEERLAPTSAREFVTREWAELGPVLRRAPRHLDRLATTLEHGRFTTRVRLFEDPTDAGVLERLLNRVVLTMLALGVGLLAVLMLGTDAGPALAGTEVRLLEVLGWFGLFGASILLLRVLLEVLRSEAGDRQAGRHSRT